MSSVSGLSAEHRVRARDRAVAAALVAHAHAPSVHYTQGPLRWTGIDRGRNARLGQFPGYADCSAFVTWCIWNGIFLPYGCQDTVNKADWRWGNTETMLAHGKPVVHMENVNRADAVIYGRDRASRHTALITGRQAGKLMVISHGSEAGPYYLPYDYRGDVLQIRRYI